MSKKTSLKWGLTVFAILLAETLLLMQLAFTAWPEMTLWPYLMLKGWLPYKDIAIVHNPLLLVELTSFYKIFGLGLLQLKIFTWSLILFSGLVTFWVVRKLWDSKIALISLLFLIPLNIYYDANGLWFDLMLAPLYLTTYYFSKTAKFKLAGLFWVLSFLVKQTAVFLLVPVFVELFRNKPANNIEKFVLGVLAIFVPFLFIIWVGRIMPDYIYWAYRFAGSKLPFSEGQISLPTLRQLILGLWPFVVSLACIFVKNKKRYIDLLFWAFFSLLGVYPRWELFHILPSVSFFAVIFTLLIIDSVKIQKFQKSVIWLGITLFILLSLKKVVIVWDRGDRFFEPDVSAASSFIKENTKDSDKILVLNFWDHVYALSDRLPVSRPWVPQFSWYMEAPGIQENMLSDLIISPPKYVIYHPYSGSGLDSYKPGKISGYVDRYYHPVKYYEDFAILEMR